jgi:hypothetical protein
VVSGEKGAGLKPGSTKRGESGASKNKRPDAALKATFKKGAAVLRPYKKRSDY